jgi:tetratricopeptide (TPR) repeat protein
MSSSECEGESVADIFVSYTSSDRDWAFWIGHELIALGHPPHIHEWEIGGGGDIMKWMDERHDTADHVLCVVSERYLKAVYSSWERRAAQWAAAKDRPNFALPVIVEPCKVPTLFAHLKRCDLYGLAEDEARARLKAFLEPARKPPRGPFPGMAKSSAGPTTTPATPFPGKTTRMIALSNVPISEPLHFVGRDDALADVDAALAKGDGRVVIIALHGLRGVGKTILAAVYAERHCGDYRATWWIKAESEPPMRADLVSLGVRLGWVGGDDKEEPALAVVMERLRHEGEGILLVFDNAIDVEGVKPYMPRGGTAHVLITSTAHAWRSIAKPIEICLWPKETGADYLIACTGRDNERTGAEALSEALGGLPLAHAQAAAYCERLDISFSTYHKRFEAAPARLLDDTRHAPADYHDGLTVAKTFALAIEEAAKLHPAAEPLIAHAALLAPEPIPLFLFAEAREEFGEPLATALDGDGLDEAVAALRTFALVDREAVVEQRDVSNITPAIRLHRLVGKIVAERYADTNARVAIMKALYKVYPSYFDIYNSPKCWPRARMLNGIVRSIFSKDALRENPILMAELIRRLGAYSHWSLGNYSEAQTFYQLTLKIYEAALGRDHVLNALTLDALALVLQAKGDLAGAGHLFRRELRINERRLGYDAFNTVTNRYNLASLLHAQGKLSLARQLYESVLASRQKSRSFQRYWPKDHPKTAHHPYIATSFNGLGLLLRDQGDLAGAEPCLKRALALREKELGPDDVRTAESLDSLASLRHIQGNFRCARTLFARALAIREKVLGPEHPDTSASLHNLATLLHAQGYLTSAQPLYERALAIRQRAIGTKHPDTEASRNNLESLLKGDLSGARPSYDCALAIRETRRSPRHVDTTVSRSDITGLLENNPARTRSLVARNLRQIREKRGLTQARLATDAELKRSYVGALEGQKRNPTADVLDRLATILAVPISEFFEKTRGRASKPFRGDQPPKRRR